VAQRRVEEGEEEERQEPAEQAGKLQRGERKGSAVKDAAS
jgi:hypothetical protein